MIRDAKAAILVVEDEAIVARDIQSTLRDLGYDALETAATCDEAVLRASERCPDLVLMDIRLRGERDGIEAAELLRRHFRVPVVFLTAYADDSTVDRAKKAQPYGYLLKPIKANELRSAVEVSLYRHEMDTRLRERERWFSTTLRSIGDGVISTDTEARITFMNAVAESLTGWRTEEAVGRPLEEVLRLVHEDARDPVENPIRRALREGRVAGNGERVALIARGGARRPVEDSAAPIVDEGDLLGAVMIFRDISARRRLESQIELADRLATVGTMAAGVAAELSDPLALVVSNVQRAAAELVQHRGELRRLLSDEAYASLFRGIEQIAGTLDEAAQGIARVSHTVSELRAFARPPTPRKGRVDLRRALGRAGEVVAHEIRSRAALAMEIGRVPLVLADEARLGQVFIHLLLNAAQSIAPGNVAGNEVRVVGGTAPDGRAVVEVRDTGCGIPADLLARIFDPFFTTKPAGSGTGLGLSVCHGIVKSLGGEIRVESRVGRGSVFSVLLPPAPANAAEAPGDEQPAAAGRAGRVLAIDDEPLVGTAIRRALEPEHRVVWVKTVREGRALIQRGESFDAILCAVVLPEVTGMDFYDDLLLVRPDVARRVVFLVGGVQTPRTVEFSSSVSNRLLEKPFTAEALRAAVGDLLSGRPA